VRVASAASVLIACGAVGAALLTRRRAFSSA